MKYNSEINITTPIFEKKFILSGKEIDVFLKMIESKIDEINEYLDHTQLIRAEWTDCLFHLEVLNNLLDWIKESKIDSNTGKKQAE